MTKDAQKAKVELKKILDIEMPTYQDPNVLKQEQDEAVQKAFDETKAKWSSSVDKLIEDQLDKLSIEYQGDDKKVEKFEFAIDAEFKKVLKDNLPQIAANYNKDISKPEDVKALVEQAQKDYLWLRRGELLRTATEDVITKMTKEQLDKYHNTSQPERTEAPATLSDEDRFNKEQQDNMAKEFKITKKQ